MPEDDNQTQPPAHQREAFDVGSVAVVNADEPQAAAATPQPPKDPPPLSKIGALAIAKADEQLLEPGEHLVTVIRRHPIGIIGIYAEMLSGILLVVGLVMLAVLGFFVSLSSQTKGLVAAMGVFVIAFLIVILFVATYVYRQCRLVVSDKSVIQVMQKALFNKKISRLSMSNVEDVNVEQKGVLPSMFNYGTLTIQTAGEVDNFVFSMCPTPDTYADRILGARQAYARAFSDDNEN
jgi:membrane protein YdbS with pleckstrin-like domain